MSRGQRRVPGRWPAARGWGPDEPEVQAEPEEAHMPFRSRSSSRLSPSMPSKQKLTLPGRRFTRSPFRALWGILQSPSISRSRRAVTLARVLVHVVAGFLQCSCHAHDSRRMFSVPAPLAPLLRAALDEAARRGKPRADVQRAHALGAVELVAGQATACRCSAPRR